MSFQGTLEQRQFFAALTADGNGKTIETNSLMSGLPTITADSAGRLPRFHTLSRPGMIAALIVLVFLFRLPGALVPHELSVDESQMLSQAMKFVVDPRPWIAADTTTSGPLNSYVITLFLLLGFRASFVLVHIVASLLVCFQILVAYLTLRRLGSPDGAVVGSLLMVLYYGLAPNKHFLNYSSELSPALALMVGFYLFVVWLDESSSQAVRRGWLLFLSGLALGLAPWFKLQAAPISCALAVVAVATAVCYRRASFKIATRVKEVIEFCAGALLCSIVMLFILGRTGAMIDFWNSYVRAAVAYTGPFNPKSMVENFLLLVIVWPLRQPLVVALLGLFLLIHGWRSGDIVVLLKRKKWTSAGILVYLGAALFAACRPPYSFSTYAIFLVAPLIYLVAAPMRDLPSIGGLVRGAQSRHWVAFGLILLLVVMTFDVARYANMGRAIMSHRWAVADSNERIADAVRGIQENNSIRRIAIWGAAPGVYVLTGILPGTRDSVAYNQVSQGPLQNYFRARFLGDLRQSQAELFIDAVAPNVFMWRGWTENDGYESDSALRSYIDENYQLVSSLTLVPGAKPVRFYLRRP